MRKKLLFLLTLTFASSAALAGGGGVDGATEFTQILNNIQLSDSYSQQLTSYSTQLQQYQAELRNLQLNPASIMGSNITQLVGGIGGVMQAGQSIGGTMAQIDGNFSRKFGSPLAGGYAQNFKTWTSTSQDTLGAAMRAAGLHRDAYGTDTAALTALYNKSQSSQGSVAAVQTLSEINVSQIQQLQKLQDLIATQNLAASTYMANQNARDQATMDANASIMKFGTPPPPNAANYGSHY